ncbi:MAG TPA: hypothetical protein VFO07_00625, partial [Roseiflexaceae bacterium]|nr:hypothetical protein [Roseiflexaceae bacterium]
LKQPGYRDMRSQRNIDIVRVRPTRLDLIDVPFKVGNPDIVSHTLELDPILYGIDPFWKVKFITDQGDPPPDFLAPGQTLNLHLQFTGGVALSSLALAPAAAPAEYGFGDVSRVDVGVKLDGEQVGGLSFELSTPKLFLPIVLR